MRNGPSVSAVIAYLQHLTDPDKTAVVVSEDDVAHPGEEFIVLNAAILEEIQNGPDDDAADEGTCRTPSCDGDAADGEGYDGYCGNCADRRETVTAAARQRFGQQPLEVIAPGDDTSDGTWGVYVGGDRAHCYRAAELSDGSWDFEEVD